ncbi:MAG: zf-HC2 domain-containing protein [Acidimicrobiia bacterium]|nr:zf-HC2 domain-containing protein [Acidimicrobiia bacterium]
MASMTPDREHISMLLSCYLDGELTPTELDEVVEALESDLDVIAEFRSLKEIRSELRTLPVLHMPLALLPGGHLGEQLSAYLDGELITVEMPIVTTHLDSCPDCRRELAELDRSRTAVRALPGVEPPIFLAPKIEEKKTRRGLRTAAALAVGAVAVTLVFAVTPLGDSHQPSAVSIIDLESRHTARASAAFVPTALSVNTP